MTVKNVLVTGGAGYIGTNLVEQLLSRGDKVTVIDRFFFGDTLADLRKNYNLRIVRDDIRTVPAAVFRGVDAVCDLAALSNDPAGELDPAKTLEINHEGRARVCKMAKEAGAHQYVLASSCSIYGFQEAVVDETSAINPLTTYAVANRRAEEAALALASPTYTTTALRQATVYGPSRRMRFDLAINGMALALHKTGAIKIMRDGTQWRPFVHVQDTCRAFLAVLDAPADRVNGQIFNVGSEDQNVQIVGLAERCAKAAGLAPKLDWYGDPDHRSYRVSFRKIREQLGYATKRTPEDGVREIIQGLRAGALVDEPRTRTVEWYKSLITWNETLRDVVKDNAVL
ncbi:MAG: NAD-dependent epimerase/dehydratase family protein [Thermoplasmatota archaeon]